MGLSGNPQVDGGIEAEGKNWLIAGISLRAPLKPIHTRYVEKEQGNNGDDDGCSTTPTSHEARIPAKLPCPPAPRKRKSTLKCNYSGVREFFTPPDLETVFKRHVERAN